MGLGVAVGRYQLQFIAKNWLCGHKRLAYCHSRALVNSVDIYKSKTKARLSGLMTCGDVWVCPICAYKIADRRKKELAYALAPYFADGYTLLLCTYTLSHKITSPLSSTLDMLRSSYRFSKSGRAYQETKKSLGIVGSIRSLEITWSPKNGYHPHYHELVICASPLPSQDVCALFTSTASRYLDKVTSLGGVVNQRGLDIRVASSDDILDYIAKQGHLPIKDWSVNSELLPVGKSGRSGSFTMFDLLALPTPRHKKVFVGYANAVHGLRQIFWSAGLKALCGLAEITDEVASRDLELGQDEVLFATLRASLWRLIVARNARDKLVEQASKLTFDEFSRWIENTFGVVMSISVDGDGSMEYIGVSPTSNYTV